MAPILGFVTLFFSLFLFPFFSFMFVIVVLASLGRSLGVRKLYVNFLIKIFEFGRKTIEEEYKWNSTIERDGEKQWNGKGEKPSSGVDFQLGGDDFETGRNSVSLNGTNYVISRQDLILVPNPEHNIGINTIPPKDTNDLSPTALSQKEEDAKKHLSVSGDASANSNGGIPRNRSFETLKRDFHLADVLDYIKAGAEAIIEDQVTSRFEAEELKSWNMLTRTNRQYEFISWKLTIIWMVGFLIRYFFLLPLRILICFFGVILLTACTALVGYVPEGSVKRWLNHQISMVCFNVLSSALSSVINYHNEENRPKRGICVANHTSPIDVLVLMCDNSYSLIGQRHGGFLGVLQRALARASPHIWFERCEVKDRASVTRRLKEHVSDPINPPILIFPEGTCINNTSVMQFKKGSFEVGSVIYPVAIKYDPKFGDAFWNSSRFSMVQYLYMMMTSWAIVCDVWYLPPMYQRENESAIDFANRVKRVIAKQGGLVDLMWDGQLKRMNAKKEWKEAQQEVFSKRLKVE